MDILNLIIKTWGDMILKQSSILYPFIALFILIFFSVLLKCLISKKLSNFGYRSLGNLFSKAEHSFFLILKQALSDEDYEIFAKVRVADVLRPEKGLNRKNWNIAFYKISSKHFDYVLCDKNTLSIVAVIELDDKSHHQSKTRARDFFIEKACETAGLKLLRFPCRANYQIQSVRDKIISSISLPPI